MKLLKYNINILTSYDYIRYLLTKNNKIDAFFLKEASIELESKIKEGVRKYIFSNPKNIAEEIITKIKSNTKFKVNILHPIRLSKNNSIKGAINRKEEVLIQSFVEKKIITKILHQPTKSMAFIDRNVTCLNEIYYNEKNNKIIYQKKSEEISTKIFLT